MAHIVLLTFIFGFLKVLIFANALGLTYIQSNLNLERSNEGLFNLDFLEVAKDVSNDAFAKKVCGGPRDHGGPLDL